MVSWALLAAAGVAVAAGAPDLFAEVGRVLQAVAQDPKGIELCIAPPVDRRGDLLQKSAWIRGEADTDGPGGAGPAPGFLRRRGGWWARDPTEVGMQSRGFR